MCVERHICTKGFTVWRGYVSNDNEFSQPTHRATTSCIYPPTTLQSVFPVADQRFSVRGVCCLRRVCGLNRRTPLLGESERILPQRGHSTKLTELLVNRLRSMGISSPENVQLAVLLVFSCSFAVSTVFVVFCCSFFRTVCRSGSFPFTPDSSALF